MLFIRPIRLFDIKKQRFTTVPHPKKKYAILSHRWDDNELSYEKLLNHSPASPVSNAKFEKFCEVALKTYRCQYVWMDSVCINQRDERELEDAIRSMYSYYRHAEVCIVYLADALNSESFATSSWFTRGWTLQELLAPSRLVFYYGDWTRIAPGKFDIRREESDGYGKPAREPQGWVEETVVKAAGIDKKLLHYHYTPSPLEYSTVLHWASARFTTREEDAAYSLVSLLNVCLPPAYDEGRERALERLHAACNNVVLSLLDNPDRHLKQSMKRKELTGVLIFAESALCIYHIALPGNPVVLQMFQTRPHPEVLTRIVFTSFPISKDSSLELFLSRADATGKSHETKLVYSGRNRSQEIIPSVVRACGACALKAPGCRDEDDFIREYGSDMVSSIRVQLQYSVLWKPRNLLGIVLALAPDMDAVNVGGGTRAHTEEGL
ncbi:hypothetical protein ONZ45_g10055 [Pleurotus djamor]|nr:hypothetical protein ONZ45_g10055 [Pleurotus djamor]